jgi:hypothetical protein
MHGLLTSRGCLSPMSRPKVPWPSIDVRSVLSMDG